MRMPPGRPLTPLTLSDDEREMLQSWTRRRTTAQALAQRARVVLECAAGKANRIIARELRLDENTVGKWRQRFLIKRVDGLLDEPRPGTPRTIADAGAGSEPAVAADATRARRAPNPRLRAPRDDLALRCARREDRRGHRAVPSPAPGGRVPQVPRCHRRRRARGLGCPSRGRQLRHAQNAGHPSVAREAAALPYALHADRS